jgi:hypothetical protein
MSRSFSILAQARCINSGAHGIDKAKANATSQLERATTGAGGFSG